jgi:hypothetical protein
VLGVSGLKRRPAVTHVVHAHQLLKFDLAPLKNMDAPVLEMLRKPSFVAYRLASSPVILVAVLIKQCLIRERSFVDLCPQILIQLPHLRLAVHLVELGLLGANGLSVLALAANVVQQIEIGHV